MIHGTPQDDFFEKNPEFVYIPEVFELIADYGKEKAGLYMWAIWMVYHPKSSLHDLDLALRIESVTANYMNEPDFEWPEVRVVLRKKETKKPKKGLDDEFDDDEVEADSFDIDITEKGFKGHKDKDLAFEETGVHQTFFGVIEIFPEIAMSYEERGYFQLMRLRDLATKRAEYLNGKDMASAVKALASSSPDFDKMKDRYLVWKDKYDTKSGGEIQSGWGSRLKNK